MASTVAFGAFPAVAKVSSFFPFATITFDAAFASFAASLRPSFALADWLCFGSIPFASRNLDARVQDVQPFRS